MFAAMDGEEEVHEEEVNEGEAMKENVGGDEKIATVQMTQEMKRMAETVESTMRAKCRR